MAISMSKFVSKICYYSESSKCDTQYPFGYGYIMQKEMKWAIACGWRETFSGSHIYLFSAANSFCTFSYWNEDHQNCIKNIFNFVKRCIYIEIYSVNTNHFHCGQLKVMQKNPVHSLLQIHKHFMLAITECNYCGRRKTFMYS